jgi:hypothetical protein
MARIRIGDLMVKAGLIDDMQLHSALAHQRQWGGRLGDVLVNNGFIDEMMLWKGLAHQLQVPLVHLPDHSFPPDAKDLLPRELCEKYQVIALGKEGRTITVASSEPNHLGGIDEIGFRLGCRLQVVLAPAREIEWALRRIHHNEVAPCPPPRTKRVFSAMPDATPDATPPAAALPALLAVEGQVAAALAAGADPQRVEAMVLQSAQVLRFLVDACVQRGIFTREEFLWRLQTQHLQA